MSDLTEEPDAGWSTGPDQPRNEPLLSAGAPSSGVPLRGVAMGFGAAIAGGWLYALSITLSGYQLGIAVIAVALLVAKAVRIGSREAAGPGVRLTSVGLTLLAMTASEYLIIRHWENAFLAAEGAVERVPLLISPVDMVLWVGESLAMDPVTLLFWALALYSAWRYSAPTDEVAEAEV